MAASRTQDWQTLEILDSDTDHEFAIPAKRINDGDDVSFFLTSKAYKDIMTFILQLNASMFPRKNKVEESQADLLQIWELGSPDIEFSSTVMRLGELMVKLSEFIEEAPPDTGPRRFGNVSFRKWYELVNNRASALLDDYLPPEVLQRRSKSLEGVTAKEELRAYLLGSFGSAQRLDYGTGHELSFLAFLGGIWKLGGFAKAEPGVEERGIVLGIIEPYLQLLSPAINNLVDIPTEGSLPSAPEPGDVAKAAAVERERSTNMYFSAIGFIYDVKKGPFWEHSPILFDVSGVKAGWAKINKGMLKMYNAEVLSKLPVVQHFPFGSLFLWEKDPTAVAAPASIHTSSHPAKPTGQINVATLRDPMQEAPDAFDQVKKAFKGMFSRRKSRQAVEQQPTATTYNDPPAETTPPAPAPAQAPASAPVDENSNRPAPAAPAEPAPSSGAAAEATSRRLRAAPPASAPTSAMDGSSGSKPTETEAQTTEAAPLPASSAREPAPGMSATSGPLDDNPAYTTPGPGRTAQ
ncbi:Serine/threonine-protein phosphatase 2A activator 1 [Coniosporium tulheliwenetii]|uniref:Serine/threonine-protein phosphatase 2A activator 1 n=1 Tax=Coniosporium tulheliwenetii TaxID=3383036 RepID=A0ACC2YYQ3_9PEZI|nr:Serine/threonine-protein phosphatase 2A activator 1 [Cladosporium sp. JES 115]